MANERIINMHKVLHPIHAALEALATATINAWQDDRTLTEAFGWNHPSLTRQDLAAYPKELATQIKSVDPEVIDDKLVAILQGVPRKLQILQSHTLPQVFNGNGPQAIPAFLETIGWLSRTLEPVLSWQSIDTKAMPAHLAKKLRSINASIEQIVPEQERLKSQITLIDEATSAAESLPTDLQALKEARSKIENAEKEASTFHAEISAKHKEAETTLKNILDSKLEAEKLVSNCEEAYRITTTKGLAAAFDQRATRLGFSIWVWVVGLIIALGVGAHLGKERVEVLSQALSATDLKWGVIWMNAVFCILSIGAPLWFAWLATKQIGERFRLAEDYGFKASVAKAYEGYRKEAARIDPAFESRLFSSALTRLEEPPLRLISTKTHGSPWHELLESDAMKRAMGMLPDLKDTVSKIVGHSVQAFKMSVPANASQQQEDIPDRTGTNG